MPTKLNGQNGGHFTHPERRAASRHRPSSIAYVKLGIENGGIILDVSESGLQLSAGETLGSDDAIPLSLQLSYRAEPIEATGQIVWLSETKRTAGVQFVELTDKARTQLRNWISSEGSAAATVSGESDERESGATALEEEAASQPLVHASEKGEREEFELDAPPAVEADSTEPAERLFQPGRTIRWSEPVFSRTDLSSSPFRLSERARASQESPALVAGEEPSNGLRIAVIAGLMVLCFAIGVEVGIHWTGRSSAVTGGPLLSAPRAAAQSGVTSTSQPPENAGSQATGQSAVQESSASPATSASAATSTDASDEVTAPDEDAPAKIVTLPQAAVTASDSIAIALRQSIQVQAEPGPESTHRPKRVEASKIGTDPLQPLPAGIQIDPNGDVVHLRLTIDDQGELKDLMPLDGRADLLSIAEEIVRGWSQTPARVGGKAIESTEDVTINFRPAPIPPKNQ